jgi:hypothetical protein
MASYWRETYTKQDGTVVHGHWVSAPSERTNTPPPVPSHARPRSREQKRRMIIAITAIVAIAVGVVVFTLTRGGSGGADTGVSAQARTNVNQAVTDLLKLRYAGKILQDGGSDSSSNCSQSSTGVVRDFLVKHPCKEYAVTSIALHKHDVSTQAVISWVVMTASGLTTQYKNLADELHRGNPPGQPGNFNGRCYASGQNGDSAWVAQVRPTGDVTADREILQAVAPAKLSPSYLAIHCVG